MRWALFWHQSTLSKVIFYDAGEVNSREHTRSAVLLVRCVHMSKRPLSYDLHSNLMPALTYIVILLLHALKGRNACLLFYVRKLKGQNSLRRVYTSKKPHCLVPKNTYPKFRSDSSTRKEGEKIQDLAPKGEGFWFLNLLLWSAKFKFTNMCPN